MHQPSSYPQAPEPTEQSNRAQATHPNQIGLVNKTGRTFQVTTSDRLQNADETPLYTSVIDSSAKSIGDSLPAGVGRKVTVETTGVAL